MGLVIIAIALKGLFNLKRFFVEFFTNKISNESILSQILCFV